MLDGSDLVERVQQAMKRKGNCVLEKVKQLARVIHQKTKLPSNREGDRTIILLRGFGNALDQAAKKAEFSMECRLMGKMDSWLPIIMLSQSYSAEMVLAELTVGYGVVILHAIRLKHDQDIILRQLALACFRFHLLTRLAHHTDELVARVALMHRKVRHARFKIFH